MFVKIDFIMEHFWVVLVVAKLMSNTALLKRTLPDTVTYIYTMNWHLPKTDSFLETSKTQSNSPRKASTKKTIRNGH